MCWLVPADRAGGVEREAFTPLALDAVIAEGWAITLEDLTVLSPYLTASIQRFGESPPTRST